MLSEFGFFHGVVLSELIHGSTDALKISRFDGSFKAGYVVGDSIGIYVKHCNKRMPPWVFSFQPDHIAQLCQMSIRLKNIFVVLVCDDDGIACLSKSDFAEIIDTTSYGAKWIRITRRPRKMYSVFGSDGELKRKVGVGEFPKKLFG